MKTGLIEVFTGPGKGKTTAALGRAIQAIMQGYRVYMIQFLKSPDSSGEHFSAELLGQDLVIRPMGRKGFIKRETGEPLDKIMAEMALEEADWALQSGIYDMVILDEVNVALAKNVLELNDVLELIDSKPPNVELIITGRDVPQEIFEKAHHVLTMKKIRHPYDSGIFAREGIEY